MTSEAKPKKATKPITSVMVVKITPPASAGSIFSLIRNEGKNAPAKAAEIKLTIIAKAITRLSIASSNQK